MPYKVFALGINKGGTAENITSFVLFLRMKDFFVFTAKDSKFVLPPTVEDLLFV